MPEHDPHFTLPECPNCAARQKAVANWEQMTWFCFACNSKGIFTIEYDVTTGATPEAA